MEHILRNVTLTALETEKPTLFTIYKLLTNTKYRKQVVGTLQDEILKTFWKNEFSMLGSYQKAEMISPITNKLGRFLTTVMTRNILNQPESKPCFQREKILSSYTNPSSARLSPNSPNVSNPARSLYVLNNTLKGVCSFVETVHDPAITK